MCVGGSAGASFGTMSVSSADPGGLDVEIFALPVGERFLIYAPLQALTALVDRSALHCLQAGRQSLDPVPAALQPILGRLQTPPQTLTPRSGPLDAPLFLGLIPTRGCNLGCRYCDFAAPKQASPVMDLGLARAALEAYFALLRAAGRRRAEIHFFGGEPFYAGAVVHFAVEQAAARAAELGLSVRFEATTNGLYSAARCRWIADRFDTLVLSLDGPPEVQERQRPALNGRPAAALVIRNAKILSDGPVELILRACVTSETVARMPATAEWMGREFRPAAVCFETLTTSAQSEAAGLTPPDPWEFARGFDAAAQILNAQGVEAVLSTADLRAPRLSFCPVGGDALIVSPDGTVAGCYLLAEEWARRGLDMRLGRLNGRGFEIDPAASARLRNLTVLDRPLCAECFCRYHCAGGCHVHHDTSAPAGRYDAVCIQTRLVTVTTLLRRLGQHDLAAAWLRDRAAAEAAAWQRSDRLDLLEAR